MAGLDTRGFMSGAVQGYGLHQGHIDNTRRREREDQQLEAWEQDREAAANDRARKRSRQDTVWDRQDTQWDQQQEDRQHQVDLRDRERARESMSNVMNNLQVHNELREDDWNTIGEVFRQHPGMVPRDLADGYRNRKMGTAVQEIQNLITDPAGTSEEEITDLNNLPNPLFHAISPENGQALDIAEDLMNPETPTNMRSPEVLWAVNRLWGNRIGEGKEVTAIVPGKQPGAVAFELSVTDPDGTVHSEPMTRNRSTAAEGDNEVLQVPVEELIGDITDAKAIYQAFEPNPESRNRVFQNAIHLGYMNAPETSDEQRMMQELINQGVDPEQARNHSYGMQTESAGFGDLIDHPQLGLGQFGPDGQWKPAGEGTGAPDSGGGSVDSLSDSDMRNWYTDTRRAVGDMFGLERDRWGEPIVGQKNGPLINDYSSLAGQYLRRHSEINGGMISPDEAIRAVRTAAGGHVLDMDEAMEISAGRVENPEQNPGRVRQMADELVADQYAQIESRLAEQLGAEPGSLIQGAIAEQQGDTDPDELVSRFIGGSQGAPQSGQPQGGTQPASNIQGQGWYQDLVSGNREYDTSKEPLPGLGFPEGSQKVSADGSRQVLGNPQPINQPTESDAETPFGRGVDRVFQGANQGLDRITGGINRGLGLVGDFAREAGDRGDESREYNSFRRNVFDMIGGDQLAQNFQSQSDEEAAANTKIARFLRDGPGQQVIGADPMMQEAFMQDPQGFIFAVEQGMSGQQIIDWMQQQNRGVEFNNQPPPIPNVQ